MMKPRQQRSLGMSKQTKIVAFDVVRDAYTDEYVEHLESEIAEFREIIRNATVDSAEEFIIISLTHDEHTLLTGGEDETE